MMTKQIRASIPDDTYELLTDACTARDAKAGDIIGQALRLLLDPAQQSKEWELFSEQLSRLLTLTTDMAKRLAALETQGLPKNKAGSNSPDPLGFYAGLAANGIREAQPDDLTAPDLSSTKRRGLTRFFFRG